MYNALYRPRGQGDQAYENECRHIVSMSNIETPVGLESFETEFGEIFRDQCPPTSRRLFQAIEGFLQSQTRRMRVPWSISVRKFHEYRVIENAIKERCVSVHLVELKIVSSD